MVQLTVMEIQRETSSIQQNLRHGQGFPNDPVQSITVKTFNMAGVPIDVVQRTDSNEAKWHNAESQGRLAGYLNHIAMGGRPNNWQSECPRRKVTDTNTVCLSPQT